MIASGGVFAVLRGRMLSAIPDGAKAPFEDEATIGDWIENGSFTVTACSKRLVTLEASHMDFGQRLLLEVEGLLNHCFEHVQEIICFSTDTRPRSDAWAAVTTYYLGFFSAAALLRLLGMPVSFFNRTQLSNLQQMAGSGQSPSQGSFSIGLGPIISVTRREIQLRPTSKIHEATWKSVLQLLNDLNRDPNISRRTDETDFYDSLCTSAFCVPGIGFDWPSNVRVRTNYRPGHAYKLHRHNLGVVQVINAWRDVESSDVFGVVRSAHRRFGADVSTLANSVGMMINVSFSLFVLVRELYKELVLRRVIDKRWERLRSQYRDRGNGSVNNFRVLHF